MILVAIIYFSYVCNVFSDQTYHRLSSSDQLSRCEENRKIWLCLEEQNNIFSNEVKTFPCVTETLKHIESRGGEQRVLVTGSLHLVGAVLSVLDQDLKYSTCPEAKSQTLT